MLVTAISIIIILSLSSFSVICFPHWHMDGREVKYLCSWRSHEGMHDRNTEVAPVLGVLISISVTNSWLSFLSCTEWLFMLVCETTGTGCHHCCSLITLMVVWGIWKPGRGFSCKAESERYTAVFVGRSICRGYSIDCKKVKGCCKKLGGMWHGV